MSTRSEPFCCAWNASAGDGRCGSIALAWISRSSAVLAVRRRGMSGSLPGVAVIGLWRSGPDAVGQLLVFRNPEQLAGQRAHPATLCGRKRLLLPGDVARIAQAASETRRVGQRPDVRPEVPATGRKAAGDGVGEVMQRGV